MTAVESEKKNGPIIALKSGTNSHEKGFARPHQLPFRFVPLLFSSLLNLPPGTHEEPLFDRQLFVGAVNVG